MNSWNQVEGGNHFDHIRCEGVGKRASVTEVGVNFGSNLSDVIYKGTIY